MFTPKEKARAIVMDHAYWLGVRDARLGHAEMHPIRPFTREELAYYRQGYSDQKITQATTIKATGE